MNEVFQLDSGFEIEGACIGRRRGTLMFEQRDENGSGSKENCARSDSERLRALRTFFATEQLSSTMAGLVEASSGGQKRSRERGEREERSFVLENRVRRVPSLGNVGLFHTLKPVLSAGLQSGNTTSL